MICVNVFTFIPIPSIFDIHTAIIVTDEVSQSSLMIRIIIFNSINISHTETYPFNYGLIMDILI